MIDGVIAGTGNSRYLKSSISADTTLAEIVTMLRAGTFPIDLNGLNAEGWTTLATALSKANLLSDTTAALINTLAGSTPSTPDAALSAITSKTQTIYDGRVQIATGSYTGSGLYGSSHPNSLTFPFIPKLLNIFDSSNINCYYSDSGGWSAGLQWIYSMTSGYVWSATMTYSLSNKTLSWYTSGAGAFAQLNTSGTTYKWVAMG